MLDGMPCLCVSKQVLRIRFSNPQLSRRRCNYFSGYMGASLCMILASWGSAWGTWRAGLGVCNMGINNPQGVIKNIVPIVMAGVLGIYGLIVSVIITQAVSTPDQNSQNTYSAYNGYVHVRRLCRKCIHFGLSETQGRLTHQTSHSSSLFFVLRKIRSSPQVSAVVYRVWPLVVRSEF